MSDVRSPYPIRSHTSLLEACEKVAAQMRLFKLPQLRLHELFEIEVYAQIERVPYLSMLDHEFLVSYARGYQECLVQSIRAAETEFVYRTTAGVMFSTKVGMSSKPHFMSMTIKEQVEATSGLVWKDAEGFAPFSEFKRRSANEEAA
jgi:hypothetical protein